ncbi:MAG: hypothetical protein U0835_02110 [Isosphaeraceae bacterium]
MTRGDALVTFGLAAAGLASSLAAGWALRRLAPAVDAMAAEEAAFLDDIPGRWLLPAVAASAAAGLVLELAPIRWQGTVWEVFAFYKNFSLLSCFTGFGLGYALAATGCRSSWSCPCSPSRWSS